MEPEPGGRGGAGPGQERWRRHPADRARLALALMALAASVALVAARPNTVRSISADLTRLLGNIPDSVGSILTGSLQLASLVAPLVLVAMLITGRQIRLLGTLVATGAAAAVAVAAVQGWLDDVVPPDVLSQSSVDSWVTGRAFPSGAYLGAAAAVVTVLSPGLPRKWRRWSLLGLLAASLCRMLTAATVPVNVGLVLALGASIGALVLVVVGAPTRRVSRAEVAAGAERAGVRLSDIERLDDDTATSHFRAQAEGGPVDVTLVGRDDRDAEIFSRLVRSLTTKDVEDAPLRLRGTSRLQHEALATLAARRLVPAPDVLGVGETPDGDAVLVTTAIVGPAVADTPSDAALDEAWHTAAVLRRHRLAHGRLTLHAFVATPEGVVLTGFRSGEVGADDTRLDTDLAELLVTTAQVVGVERTVEIATAAPMPEGTLSAVLPRIQPQALSGATRRAVPDLKTVCADLRDGLAAAVGVEEVEVLDLARITPGKAMNALGGVVLAALVVAFVGNASTVWDSLLKVDWSVFPVLVAMVVAGYFAGAWGLVSAVTVPLPFMRTTQVMWAQTFLNRFTPANAGGMALRTRYLQKHGVSLTGAATSVGLTSAASGVVQAVFLVGVFLWAGSSGPMPFGLPDASSVAIGLLVVGLVGGVIYVVPAGRRLVYGRLLEVVGDAWANLRDIFRQPSKAVGLFGSQAVSKITTIAAFVASCAAADIPMGTAQLTFLYMTANTVAAAAPTPGGMGAVEAALIAALTGSGVDPSIAVAAVVVFRLVTFWMPVPPSYAALHHLRKLDAV